MGVTTKHARRERSFPRDGTVDTAGELLISGFVVIHCVERNAPPSCDATHVINMWNRVIGDTKAVNNGLYLTQRKVVSFEDAGVPYPPTGRLGIVRGVRNGGQCAAVWKSSRDCNGIRIFLTSVHLLRTINPSCGKYVQCTLFYDFTRLNFSLPQVSHRRRYTHSA